MSSFSWQTTPGQLPPSAVLVASGGTTWLADWNGSNIYIWDGTTLITEKITGASGFCAGIQTPEGVSILSHEGIVVTFTAPGTYTSVDRSNGNAFTAIASDGTISDYSGNLYLTSGSEIGGPGGHPI